MQIQGPSNERIVFAGDGKDNLSQEESLRYAVKGRPAFAFVDIFLPKDARCLGDAGAMLWMDGEIQIETGCHGGCCSSFARSCAGESCCQNLFIGPNNGGQATFGFELPGDLLPFGCTPGNGWVVTRGGFICGSSNIVVSARFAGCGACCFGGEGPFLTKVSCEQGKGMFFAGAYGALERHDIPGGKMLFVDAGLFFAAHETVQIRVGLAGGLKTCLCGGQAFVMKFSGPCVVYTKSRDPAIFDRMTSQGGQDGAAAGAGAGAGAAAASN
jgi:uncharacterized protein (TIGR00266 family)